MEIRNEYSQTEMTLWMIAISKIKIFAYTKTYSHLSEWSILTLSFKQTNMWFLNDFNRFSLFWIVMFLDLTKMCTELLIFNLRNKLLIVVCNTSQRFLLYVFYTTWSKKKEWKWQCHAFMHHSSNLCWGVNNKITVCKIKSLITRPSCGE